MEYIWIKSRDHIREYPLTESARHLWEAYREDACGEGQEALKERVCPARKEFVWKEAKSDAEIMVCTGKKAGKVFAIGEGLSVSGKRDGSDIFMEGFPNALFLRENALTIEKESDSLYVNGMRQNGTALLLQDGDEVFLEDALFLYLGDRLEVCAGHCESVLWYEDRAEREAGEGEKAGYPEDFPRYKRSPRIFKELPQEKIEILKVPDKAKMSRASILQVLIPPLGMMLVTVGVSILLRRGSYILLSLSMTLMTAILSIFRYVSDKKVCKDKNIERERIYKEYLLSIRKRLHAAYEREEEVYRFHYPDAKTIEGMVLEQVMPDAGKNHVPEGRIYEKTMQDADFLEASIGTAKGAVNFPIRMEVSKLKADKDPLEEEAVQIRDRFHMISEKPVVVSLFESHLGILGEPSAVLPKLQDLIAQLAFFHSYKEVQMVAVFSKEHREYFDWMQWLPHVRQSEINVLGLVDSEHIKDMVLGSLTQTLKAREAKREENKDARFSPHYLLVVEDAKQVQEHPVMEYLSKDGQSLGFSLIYPAKNKSLLPEFITTVYSVKDSVAGSLLMLKRQEAKKEMVLRETKGADFLWMARNLSVLIHEEAKVSCIPERVTFFEMLGVKKPSELDIETKWEQNLARKSLAVPLGFKTQSEMEMLNLHEKSDGPHGLIAGTTGSGKSELLQSYILSLAVHFHPHEVGFLLIDYKGGGMAGLFAGLPHLLGVITNLDGAESRRALVSIKSELAGRQRIFGAHKVNHIHDYNRLFCRGEVREPVPHLFIISDEFAELKKEQPDFMKELVSTARIGRSLGVHLILATQQPAGVVDDQIWTNSHFKIALKLQNESDSRDILKTADAASITLPGRAYLKVGNNERYELFQSAYSGAAYNEDKEKREFDERVFLVNSLGQGEVLGTDEDESISFKNERLEGVTQTQLDATIQHLKEVFDGMGLVQVKRPWLEPLPEVILSPMITGRAVHFGMPRHPEAPNLSIQVGIADIPEEQSQVTYSMDLAKEGNVSYFASSGFGKTTFLMTVLLSLAMQNSVDGLNLYILDYGNSGLILLNDLPHTADYLQEDDAEKLGKFMKRIREEIRRRKRMFALAAASNFTVYNAIAPEPIKAIVIAVDQFDVVKELGAETEDFFARLVRDGAGLGIFTVMTATRQSAVKYSVFNHFKLRLAGFLYDEHEVSQVVGRSSVKIGEIKGRVLVKLDTVCAMQVFSMCKQDNDLIYIQGIKELVQDLQRQNEGKKAERIVVLPEELNLLNMAGYAGENDVFEIPVGLEMQEVRLLGMRSGDSPFLVIGDASMGKTSVLFSMLHGALENSRNKHARIFVFDSGDYGLSDYAGKVEYIRTEEEALDMADEIMEECMNRRNGLLAAMQEGVARNPREYYSTCTPHYIFIDDVDDFMESMNNQMMELFAMLKQAADTGIGLILSIHASRFKQRNEFTNWIRSASSGLLIGNPGLVSILQPGSTREYTTRGYGLLFQNGSYRKVMLPSVE